MPADVEGWAQAGLRYEVVDSVAWLRLNRPEKRNAMDHYPGGAGPGGMGLRDALLFAIRDASEDKEVKVAVITGSDGVFSAGADLRQPGGALEIPEDRRRATTVARDDGVLYGWYRLFEAIWRSETPTRLDSSASSSAASSSARRVRSLRSARLSASVTS